MQQSNILVFAKSLMQNERFYANCQVAIAAQFSLECQRFRMIKGTTELTTADLDTIGINAARNYLNSIAVNEFPVTFQTVSAA